MTGCPEETKPVVQPSVLARVVVRAGAKSGPGRGGEREGCEMCRWRKDASRGRGSATFEVDVAVDLARLVIRCGGNLLQGLFHRPEVCGLWTRGKARQVGQQQLHQRGSRRGRVSQICRRGRTTHVTSTTALHWSLQPLQLFCTTPRLSCLVVSFCPDPEPKSPKMEDVGSVAADKPKNRRPRIISGRGHHPRCRLQNSQLPQSNPSQII